MNIEEYMEQYDEIASEVCNNDEPNMMFEDISNDEISMEICDALDIDTFDLLEDFSPNKALKTTNANVARGYAMLYLLRMEVFLLAKIRKIGNKDFNDKVIANSEYYYLKFSDIFKSIRLGEPVKHMWLH